MSASCRGQLSHLLKPTTKLHTPTRTCDLAAPSVLPPHRGTGTPHPCRCRRYKGTSSCRSLTSMKARQLPLRRWALKSCFGMFTSHDDSIQSRHRRINTKRHVPRSNVKLATWGIFLPKFCRPKTGWVSLNPRRLNDRQESLTTEQQIKNRSSASFPLFHLYPHL